VYFADLDFSVYFTLYPNIIIWALKMTKILKWYIIVLQIVS